jgi:hypothetical protein
MEGKYNVIELSNFKKELKQLSKKYPSIKNDVDNLKEVLKGNPLIGESLGKGYYKVRMKITSKGQGKSGGARIITNVKVINNVVFLATIYDKSDMESISKQQLASLKELIDKISDSKA